MLGANYWKGISAKMEFYIRFGSCMNTVKKTNNLFSATLQKSQKMRFSIFTVFLDNILNKNSTVINGSQSWKKEK